MIYFATLQKYFGKTEPKHDIDQDRTLIAQIGRVGRRGSAISRISADARWADATIATRPSCGFASRVHVHWFG
jgi:transposase